MLVAVDYIFSISDNLVNQLYQLITKNSITDDGYQFYINIRAVLYGGITMVLVPWLIFLSFASSFINRNQDIIGYLIGNLLCVLFTPMAIYLFTRVATQLLSVTILDTSYMAFVFFNDFLYIMVANLLLSLASFVFLQKKNIQY